MKVDLILRSGKYFGIPVQHMTSSRSTLYQCTLNNEMRVIKVYAKNNSMEQQRAMYITQHLYPRLRKHMMEHQKKFLWTTILQGFPVDFGSILIEEERFSCAIFRYIPGFDLYDRSTMKLSLKVIDKSRVEFKQYIKVAYELAYTIDLLHKYEFIHGDLAPTNIRLNILPDHSLQLTIMDLDGSGYASNHKGGKDTSDLQPLVKGTGGIPGFAAPKEFFNNTVSKETDNWFLAMLIYHLITRGYTPYYFLEFSNLKNIALRRGFLSMKNARWPPSRAAIIEYLPDNTVDIGRINSQQLDMQEQLLSKLLGSSDLFFKTFAYGYANKRNRTSSNKFSILLGQVVNSLNLY
ncbi:MAG: protein kinase [Candidatus Heimdallarchaeota archaeon]|nr:protein kinase [Candidatus Heimdallarchaeota archaeon]